MKSKKKQLIFEFGKSSINKIMKQCLDVYVCPICLTGYENIKKLTLEHVPPKSVGGIDLILTCSKCNNNLGSQIDSNVKTREVFRSLDITNIRNKQFYLTVYDHKILTEVNFADNKVFFKTLHNLNNPQKLEAFKSEMNDISKNNKWDGLKFNIISRETYLSKNTKVSDLKTAYLIAFAKFGYRYIFDPRLEIIRNQINNMEENSINNFVFYNQETVDKFEIILVKNPFVFLLIKFLNSNVVLPWFNSPENFYDKISCIIEEKGKLHMSGIIYEFSDKPEFLYDNWREVYDTPKTKHSNHINPGTKT